MNENHDEEEIIEIKENIETEKQILENKKKQEEIATKRKEISPFKTEHLESLEISESEPFYRTALTNIIEGKDGYYISIELPGLNKKNVKITLEEGILEIVGEKKIIEKEKKEEKKDKDKKEKKDKDKKKEKIKEIKGDYLRREFRPANFYRCFYLPEDISTEDIDAKFKNGILQLIILKKTAKISEKQVIEIK